MESAGVNFSSPVTDERINDKLSKEMNRTIWMINRFFE